MRKIVAGLFMSLDGVVDEPGNWSMPYFNEQVGEIINANMQASDAMLLGRRTYEAWADYWPGKTGADDPFADYINSVPKFVASRTLEPPLLWEGSTLISGSDQIEKLKEEPGKGIATSGSITLVGSLLREGLLDELSLLISPIVLGSGKRLFGSPEQVPLRLIESRTLDNGVLAVRYEKADAR